MTFKPSFLLYLPSFLLSSYLVILHEQARTDAAEGGTLPKRPKLKKEGGWKGKQKFLSHWKTGGLLHAGKKIKLSGKFLRARENEKALFFPWKLGVLFSSIPGPCPLPQPFLSSSAVCFEIQDYEGVLFEERLKNRRCRREGRKWNTDKSPILTLLPSPCFALLHIFLWPVCCESKHSEFHSIPSRSALSSVMFFLRRSKSCRPEEEGRAGGGGAKTRLSRRISEGFRNLSLRIRRKTTRRRARATRNVKVPRAKNNH